MQTWKELMKLVITLTYMEVFCRSTKETLTGQPTFVTERCLKNVQICIRTQNLSIFQKKFQKSSGKKKPFLRKTTKLDEFHDGNFWKNAAFRFELEPRKVSIDFYWIDDDGKMSSLAKRKIASEEKPTIYQSVGWLKFFRKPR